MRREVLLFVMFSFFIKANTTSIFPWNRANYTGREESKLLICDCLTLPIGNEMPAMSFFWLNLLFSEVSRNSSFPAQSALNLQGENKHENLVVGVWVVFFPFKFPSES